MTIYLGMMFAKISTRVVCNLCINILFPVGVVCVVIGKWKQIAPVPDHCFHFIK